MSTIIDQNNRHRPLDNWRRGLCGSGGIVGGSYGFMRESMPLLASDLNRPVEPDIATVEMGTFVFEADLLKGKQEVDAKIASLLGTFKTLGVASEDIRTTQLYVNPKYKDIEDKWQFVGYEITRSVTVTLRDLTKLNELLDKSIKAGANRLEEIELSSSKEREIRDKTLGQAIEDAKQQAARLAGGFGAKVGKVLTIETGGGTFSAVYCMSAPAFGEATFQPGRIRIESELNVVFELTD